MYAGIDIPARAAFAEAERILNQNLIIVGVLTALTLVAAWFGADLFVLRRVRDLMGATRQLAAGDLKARTGLPYGGSELGHLARTFDDLAQALEQRATDAEVADTEDPKTTLTPKRYPRNQCGDDLKFKRKQRPDCSLRWNRHPVSLFMCDSQLGRRNGGTIEPIEQPVRNDTVRQIAAAREHGLPQEVFKIKLPLLISNVQTDPRTADPDSLRAAGIITYLGLPMIVKEEVLGVLSFFSTEAIDLRTEEETFLTDLTQQAAIAVYNSRLYEQTRNQAAELEKSNRIKDEFLGVVSHELRTPLNIIMNCTEALTMGVFGEITAEHEKGTGKIRMQASHLLSLINGILEITKIETGGITVNSERINLSHLVTELKSDYAMVSKEKCLAINWHVPPDLPDIVCDRMKLRQLVINLVNNAIKFTDQGSVDISFRTVVDEPFVEFSVADTGIGMAEESLPHIFDKFRQVDSTTTRHYSGAGLGLYLVKSFAAVMGGSVSVQSTLGEGTTFTVRIPIGTAAGFLEDTAVSPNITATGIVPSAYLEGEL